ncbi:LysR family transcriptional regulator [Ruegeria sediminis]|uniref:LysR family transcriptional regulator n=1 Tax=Ruegeria sediminis TaxID=2583820 RepID=A0ABY2X2F2_9RHOB|nr:LysR family transcriptional regulator [Ruegeria sediminis]TMV09028.1 LysR family transcriptional regulator [Ruegeria sediminis]
MKISGTDIHLLTVFDSVVRNNGFSAAQAELGLSQPTISNHITALEERLGVKLCQRGRRGFLLTDEGRMVHEIGLDLLETLDAHSGKLAAIKGSLAGRLKVAMVDCIATDPHLKLPDAIGDLAASAPSVRLELSVDQPQNILTGVVDGDYHLGIGGFDNRISGLDYEDLYDEQHALYCGKGHPLFDLADEEITQEAAYAHPWAHRGYWSRQRQKSFMQVDADRIVHCIEAQIVLVLSGSCLGLLPTHHAAMFAAAGRLRRLPVTSDDFTSRMQMVTRSGPKPKVIAFFRDALHRRHSR